MRKRIDIRSIQIYGRSKILAVALVIIITGDSHMQHLADIAVNDHRDSNISGKSRPPGEVRGTHAKRSKLNHIGNRRRCLVGIFPLDGNLDIVAAAGQPFRDILFDGDIGGYFHLLYNREVGELRVLHHDGTESQFSGRFIRLADVIPIL